MSKGSMTRKKNPFEMCKQIMQKQVQKYKALMSRPLEPDLRAILFGAEIGSYIETQPNAKGECQSGTIINMLRDREGIPACFMVTHDEWPFPNRRAAKNATIDLIPATSVVFYEPWSEMLPPAGCFEDPEDGSELDDETIMDMFGVIVQAGMC